MTQPDTPATARLQALCNQGLGLHQAERLEEARRCYDEVLRRDPANFNALYLLGSLYAQAGHSQLGASLLERAIGIDPAVAAAHGVLALALIDLGRPADGLAALDRAIGLDSDDSDAHYSRGLALTRLQRPDEAIASYESAIALLPEHAEAHNNRGVLLGEVGRVEEALVSYESAIRFAPGFAEAHNNRATALHVLGQDEESIAACDRAIALKPGYAMAHYNRGVALLALGRRELAIVSYDAAIALAPDTVRAHADRGYALNMLRRFDEALSSFNRAIALRPDNARPYNNRGSALYELARLDEALASFDAAVALEPDTVEIRTNRAATLLLAGHFDEGWREFEWRKANWEWPENYFDPVLAWLGEADLAGKRLFVHHEQGLGDTIQFARYLPLLRDMGADVVLSAQAPLKSLLQPLTPDEDVLVGDQRPSEFDYHCSLLSLPLAFGTRLDTIPSPSPYLLADPARRARFESVLTPTSKPRLGLAWSGNPAHDNDHNRSIAFSRLAPMLDDTVDWTSLQNAIRPEDAATLATIEKVRFLGPWLNDFADTAALVDCMDLVITVDTSIAHLAGAMGKPVWILLPFRPDWRWLMHRGDSPWYPSARLFRQSRPGEWDSVIEDVRARLSERFG